MLGRWQAAGFRSRSIGYADQHYWRALAGELTARELVGVQLGLAGESRSRRDARAEELLARVGLGDRRDAHPRELSGGEQQRIALCAALAGRPHLLIADEPTGELDAAHRARGARPDRRADARGGRHGARRQPRSGFGGPGGPRRPRPRRPRQRRARRGERRRRDRRRPGRLAAFARRICFARPGSAGTRRAHLRGDRSRRVRVGGRGA